MIKLIRKNIMKNIKKLSIFILISTLIISLTGCSSKTDALFKALEKSADMEAYSFKMDGNINVTAKESSENNPLGLDLSNMSISSEGQTVKGNDTSSKIKMNLSLGIMGINIDMDVMADAKVEKDKLDYKVFIQIPDMLKAMGLGTLYGDADYFYLDTAQMEELQKQSGEANSSNAADYFVVKKEFDTLEKGLISFTKDYAKKNKDFIKIASDKEITLNNISVKADEYTIFLDNAAFKAYLKACLSDDARKKELQNFTAKMEEISPSENTEENSGKLTAKDFEDAIKNIDSMKDFIGSEGITLNFYVKDGYIVKINSKFHVIAEDSSEAKYTFNMDWFNINEKLDVEIPTKDSVKTVNLMDLMKLSEQGMQ